MHDERVALQQDAGGISSSLENGRPPRLRFHPPHCARVGPFTMLSYRHAFHAGNHADVLKHAIVAQRTPTDSTPRPRDCHLDSGRLEALGIGRRTPFDTAIASLLTRYPDVPADVPVQGKAGLGAARRPSNRYGPRVAAPTRCRTSPSFCQTPCTPSSDASSSTLRYFSTSAGQTITLMEPVSSSIDTKIVPFAVLGR